MKDIKSEFSTIIGSYEKQISELKMESQILKRSRNGSVSTASPGKKTTSILFGHDDDDTPHSPILPLRTNEFNRTAHSHFYRTDKK